MSVLVSIVAYLSILCFLGVLVYKVRNYMNKPMHVRWELYPVAHEAGARAGYGGSFMEDKDWWEKPRETSLVNEMKVMIPEMLLMHAAWEHNRSLWYRSYPFHFGLYMVIGATALSIFAAFLSFIGVYLSFVSMLINIMAIVGFIAIIFGAIALAFKRISDPGLKKYTTPEHFFNLIFAGVAAGFGLLAAAASDYSFAVDYTSFWAGLITFSFPGYGFLFGMFLLLFFLFVAYFPITHMSHFFMKYFLYHDIRWDDEPSRENEGTQKKIGEALGFPISWSADHVKAAELKNWAAVAMHNPVEEEPKDKE